MQTETLLSAARSGFLSGPVLGVQWGPHTGRSLRLDITSYLLSSHFGFLAAIEGAFRPIGISTDLISSLQLMRDRLSAGTTDLAGQRKRILELVASGKIQVLSAMDDDLRSVVGPETSFAVPPGQGDVIICSASALAELARQNLLESAVDDFTLVAKESEIEIMRAEVESEFERQRLSVWIAEEIEHVRRGLASGAYALQPLPVSSAPPSSNDAVSLSIVEPCQDHSALMWVDTVTASHPGDSAQSPILNIYDVLAGLRESRQIDEAHFYEIMLRMRDANVLCLPLTPAEILFCLRHSRMQGSALVEDGPLSILRRNLALSLEPKRESKYLEATRAYAESLLCVAEEAIVRCWVESPVDPGVAVAWADWLFECVSKAALAVVPPEQEPSKLAGIFAGIIARAFQLLPGSGRQVLRRRALLEWLESRLSATQPTEDIRSSVRFRVLGFPQELRDQILEDPVIRSRLSVDLARNGPW